MPDASTINATGLLLVRDRQGEDERAFLSFRLAARAQRHHWAMTRVLMVDTSKEAWELAV
jgi:hypothetical protein